MLNPQEASFDLKKFLKKLQVLIEREASMTFFGTKVLDKKKVDDILCCIEASFSDDYKKFVRNRKLKSYTYYLQLLAAIKNRFFFSTTVYAVKYKEALPLIMAIHNAIDSDIKFIYSDQSGMF